MMLRDDPVQISQGFSKYFSIEAAISEAQRNEVFRLRHDVYCRDLGFEALRADERETDEVDWHSVQCLLRTRTEPSMAAGCARLVMTNPSDQNELLPFEVLCADVIDRSILDPEKLPRHKIAEVSRLAVHSHFRRRRGEQTTPVALSQEDYDSATQPRYPYVVKGLILGALALANYHDIEFLFVITEVRLRDHLAKIGFDLCKIGEPIEHRGLRVPSVMRVQQLVDSLKGQARPLWELIKGEIEGSLVRTAA